MVPDDYTPEELARRAGSMVIVPRSALFAALPHLTDRGRRAVARAMGLPLTADRRVHVFHWGADRWPTPAWTWCPEVDGTVHDSTYDLVACGSWAEACEQAAAWLRSGRPARAAHAFRRKAAG